MPTPIDTILVFMFVIIDDFCKQTVPRRRGPQPQLSDSELLTIVLYTELLGITSESAQHRYAQRHLLQYFPCLPERSRFHRRAVRLTPLLNQLRCHLVTQLEAWWSDLHVIDSTPIPVITWSRAHKTPLFPEGTWGYCAARHFSYYGFKLHLVTTAVGIPLHFELTPANMHDVTMAKTLLQPVSRSCTVLADKGYLSAELQQDLKTAYDIALRVPTRKSALVRESVRERRLANQLRQRIEVVNGIFKDLLSFEHTLAKTLVGLAVRITRKITAFTLALYLNRHYGRELLAVKTLLA